MHYIIRLMFEISVISESALRDLSISLSLSLALSLALYLLSHSPSDNRVYQHSQLELLYYSCHI